MCGYLQIHTRYSCQQYYRMEKQITLLFCILLLTGAEGRLLSGTRPLNNDDNYLHLSEDRDRPNSLLSAGFSPRLDDFLSQLYSKVRKQTVAAATVGAEDGILPKGPQNTVFDKVPSQNHDRQIRFRRGTADGVGYDGIIGEETEYSLSSDTSQSSPSPDSGEKSHELPDEFYNKVEEMTPEESDLWYMSLMTLQCQLMDNTSYADIGDDQLYCNSTFDRVLCWPMTAAGQIATQPCPPEFAGVKYLKYGNATKECHPNGTWELKTDYNQCHPQYGNFDPATAHNFAVRRLYYVGFTVSTISCVVALCIFLNFRSLWCARNKIHCHLIVTFVLRNILWLMMDNIFPKIIEDEENRYQWVCKAIVSLFNYAQVTNFFWMLVEGLYLHMMIVWTFSIDRIKLRWYIVLGWCVPAVIVLIWAIVKVNLQDNSCWMPENVDDSADYQYIYIVPILLVLLINVSFLISIVVVLVTKLRASNTMVTRQYKKAVKATVILLPLLGVTYILFLFSPGEDQKVSNLVFLYFNAILQSTQGLAVTTFYCFLNGEVRGIIRSRWERWREGRSVTTRYTRASIGTHCEALRGTNFQPESERCNGVIHHDNDVIKANNKNNNQGDAAVPLHIVHSNHERCQEDNVEEDNIV